MALSPTVVPTALAVVPAPSVARMVPIDIARARCRVGRCDVHHAWGYHHTDRRNDAHGGWRHNATTD